MPQLYFTDLAVLRCPAIVDGVTHELLMPTAAAAEATGLSDGMPFILDECGGYDVDLNRFFRACPTMGVRSSNSLRAYARDLLVWMRFLCERGGASRSGKPIAKMSQPIMPRAADQRRFTASPPHHGPRGGGTGEVLWLGSRRRADRQIAIRIKYDVAARTRRTIRTG